MKSFIPWIGGKSLLAKKIVSMFPEKIDRYIEVFGGGGSVLFAKEKHAQLEVYNDANGHLVNLFRCIRFHREELQREILGYINAVRSSRIYALRSICEALPIFSEPQCFIFK